MARPVTLLLLLVALAFASSFRERQVLLQNQVIHSIHDTHLHLQAQLNQPHILDWLNKFPSDAQHQFLVTLQGPITPQLKSRVETAAGHALVHYIPHNSFLVYTDVETAKNFLSIPGVTSATLYLPQYKSAMDLSSQIQLHQQRPATDSFDLWIQLAPTTDQTRLRGVHPLNVFDNYHHDLESLFAKWTASFPESIRVSAISNSKVQVSINAPNAVNEVVKFLAEDPAVHFIESVPKLVLHNHYSAGLVQSGNDVTVTDDNVRVPYWTVGLQGEGYVVGVGDTGLDYNSCFFYDPAVPIQFDVPIKNHRKIVAYFTTYGDSGDEPGGHGTHVCGSVAGEPLTNNGTASTFNGMAPKAKLSFMDLLGPKKSLDVPNQLGSKYFQPAYDLGARIYSSSWGSETSWYTQMAQEVDKFVWANRDFLPLFSAGNSGSKGYYTVGSPSIAKNCLSVAAHESTKSSWANYFMYQNIEIDVQNQYNHSFYGLQSAFSTKLKGSLEAEMVIASPADGCQPLSSVQGKVVLIDRGTCTFLQKAQNGFAGGAAAVIVVNNQPGPPIPMGGGDDAPLPIPVAMVTQSDGAMLKNHAGTVVNITRPRSAIVSPTEGPDILASFSSRGPTYDGRNKPDLAGPGDTIFSANSHGMSSAPELTCSNDDLIPMRGTSMSCPTISGFAVIVREYFERGFYPSGQATQSAAINPSGALIKAALIHSTVPLAEAVNDEGILTPLSSTVPTAAQGYGKVKLDTVLKLSAPNVTKSTFELFVSDNLTIDTLGLTTFCFTVNPSTTPFRVTIVWADYPASLTSMFALVNNLDLIVTSSDGQVFLGNSLFTESSSSNGLYPEADALNNVESVYINRTTTEAVQYTVTIVGKNVPNGPQPFALVVTGDFTQNSNISKCRPTKCPLDCSSHGTCQEGLCTCDAGYAGTSCELTATALKDNEAVSGFVSPYAFSYYQFEIPKGNKLNLIVNLTVIGDINLLASASKFPTIESHDTIAPEQKTINPTTYSVYLAYSSDEVLSSTYYFAVFGSCCNTTQFSIQAHLTRDCVKNCTSSSNKTGIIVASVFASLIVVVVVAAIAVYLYKRRQRNSEYRRLLADAVEITDD